jgi:hypothetical protein
MEGIAVSFEEGKGWVTPAPIHIRVELPDRELIAEEAMKLAGVRRWPAGRDQWERGLADALPVGRYRVPKFAAGICMHKIAEWALCLYLNPKLARADLLPDFVRRRWGSGGIDQDVYGRTIRVISRTRTDGPNYVEAIKADGRETPIRADCIVFARYQREDPDFVSLLGIASRRTLKEYHLCLAKAGHYNIAVDDDHLDPMCRLANDLQARETNLLCR